MMVLRLRRTRMCRFIEHLTPGESAVRLARKQLMIALCGAVAIRATAIRSGPAGTARDRPRHETVQHELPE
jgi:hypothetical protein